MSRSTHSIDLPLKETPTNRQFHDLRGKKYGNLLVVGYVGKIKTMPHCWLAMCGCGRKTIVSGSNIARGNTKSCGCLHSKKTSTAKTTHGFTRSWKRQPEYTAYHGMKSRCYRKGNIGYYLYGGRGIAVCDRWLVGGGGESGFECFVKDMGRKPSRKHSIDRINVEGDYSPENCRWATVYQQVRNTRRNRWVDFRGERMILSDAIRLSGLKRDLVYQRLSRGKSVEQALIVHDLRGAKNGD